MTEIVPIQFATFVSEPGPERAVSTAAMAGLTQLANATPEMIAALRASTNAGTTFRIAFSPEAMQMYADGTAKLMQSADFARSIMTSTESGQIIEHGTVIAEAVGSGAKAALAATVLPALIATAATYAQQRRMELALEAIKKAVEGLAQRALDTENGTCLAAERFTMLAAASIQAEGALGPYLRNELALHRQAVAAVHEARQLYIERFDRDLTAAQNKREAKKGDPHPWVALVADMVKEERLVEELELYATSLVTDVRLALLSSQALLEDGCAAAAMALAEETARRFRERFYAYFRRIRPLGEIAPERRLWDKLPFVGEAEERAFATLQHLVQQLKAQVEPLIPPEAHDRDAYIDIGPRAGQVLLQLVEAA